ncbi:MAG TPA: GYD domain-containing protein [Thermoanaerobaculia bacterium]|nr:GYD domain-containing protein [Thermoanaerobaculia bacterium]
MCWAAPAIAALTLIGVAIGRVPGLRMNRATIALVGAVAMVAVATIHPAVAGLGLPLAVTPEPAAVRLPLPDRATGGTIGAQLMTGGRVMATYIALIDFTRQGVDAVHETTRRAAAFKRRAKKQGAKVRHVFWTLGSHDGVLVFDAPDAETATALLIELARGGNVRTDTLRAFDEAEMGKLLERVG